jgi:hypothetical protein
MQRRVEYVMSAEEHGTLTNIIGTVKLNTNMLIDLLKTKDCSKEELISFLADSVSKLETAEKILRNYDEG